MNSKSIHRLWKKSLPFVFGAIVLGSAGSALASKYLGGGDCCHAGAECCKPGASCCNGKHKVADATSLARAQ